MQPAILVCALPYRDVNVPTVEHLASWPLHTHTNAIIQCYPNKTVHLKNMGHLVNAQDINTFCIHIFLKL